LQMLSHISGSREQACSVRRRQTYPRYLGLCVFVFFFLNLLMMMYKAWWCPAVLTYAIPGCVRVRAGLFQSLFESLVPLFESLVPLPTLVTTKKKQDYFNHLYHFRLSAPQCDTDYSLCSDSVNSLSADLRGLLGYIYIYIYICYSDVNNSLSTDLRTYIQTYVCIYVRVCVCVCVCV
jgi:hypothetical protein